MRKTRSTNLVKQLYSILRFPAPRYATAPCLAYVLTIYPMPTTFASARTMMEERYGFYGSYLLNAVATNVIVEVVIRTQTTSFLSSLCTTIADPFPLTEVPSSWWYRGLSPHVLNPWIGTSIEPFERDSAHRSFKNRCLWIGLSPVLWRNAMPYLPTDLIP